MSNYEEIIITWSKRTKLESIDDIANIDSKFDNVLYQLYGDSHIYGKDVLLYIGISKGADRRLKTHLKNVFGFVNNLSVSIGDLDDFNGNLEIPESILIANHKPSYNKEFIHDLSPLAKSHKIIVINNGQNSMLKTCCTNFWWVNGTQNLEVV